MKKKIPQTNPTTASRLWPDLVFIDGGEGQLRAARETLAGLGIEGVPLVRASPRDRTATPGGKPSTSPAGNRSGCRRATPVLYFIQRLRDEAHRFAIGSPPPAPRPRHPRSRIAGDRRHRPGAQARLAAPFRHPQGDRTHLHRRPDQSSRCQRRHRAPDL